MVSFQVFRLTFWAIGLMVGAGIYALIGSIVEVSGTWAPLMFVVASLVMLLNGFALAGTVRRFSHAGSILAVVKQTLPPWVAMPFEFLRLVEGGLALCVTSKLTATFAVRLAQGAGAQPSLVLEAAILLGIAFVVHRGLDAAVDLGNVGTLVEVGGLVLVIAAALTMQTAPSLASSEGPGAREAMVSVTRIVFAFGGVQGVLDVAGDVEEGEKVLPRTIMGAIAITGCLYTCVCCAALSMVGVEGLKKEAVSPLGMVLERAGFPIGTEAALALVSLLSVGNTCAGIFTFVSRIAVSFGHAYGGSEVPPIMVYSLMIAVTLVVGQLDVFALAGRIGVMLLITFAVVDYAFVVSIAQTNVEKVIGVAALLASCIMVIVDQLV